jgi:probable rRNA maturation factor
MAEAADVVVAVTNNTEQPIDGRPWAALVRDVLVDEGVRAPAETNVVFVTAPEMSELNAQHMGGEGPTDVLSFPIDDDEGLAGPGPRFVGDIVVCPEVAAANAPDHTGHVDDEIALLLVHATLHLLGHDHTDDAERDAMWAAERRHLERSWRSLARDPWVVEAG